MTNKSLQRSNTHLADHRRIILSHSAAAALAGFLPIPFVEDQLPALVRRAMIRRLAQARHVDLDEEAVREIAEGRVPPPTWRSLIGLGSLVRSARRSVRTALLAYSVYRRADAAGKTFALGTLFDHYCARHHVGVGLDAIQARALREQIERALAEPGGSFGGYAFRRGFQGALRATVRAPLELLSALSFGRLRRLRGAGEVEAEEIVETTIDETLAKDKSFLSRAVGSVDRQLSSLGGGWVDGLVDTFERNAR